MKDIKLHITQEESLYFLVDSVESNKPIVALIGAGGTGKSEILSRFKPLYKSYENNDKKIFYTATTNKAVSRLKADIPGATTLHSAVSMPKYTPLYENLEDYFEKMPSDPERKVRYKKNYLFRSDTLEFLQDNRIEIKKFDSHLDIIFSLGLSVFDKPFFDRYIVKDRIINSVVLIDEASMLSTKSEYKVGSLVTIGVDTASMVFDNIILVGDSSQLPPINGKSSFDSVESYELTKNFRSEKDLLHAIQWARDGKSFYNYVPEEEDTNVRVVNNISKQWYINTYGQDNVVHICYTNKTRHLITKRVREERKGRPEIGEPIILRGNSVNGVSKGEIGIYDGEYIVFESGKILLRKYHNFDEYEKEKWSIFQFAYASTAHMYQGSAADHVIIHLYDIPTFIDIETRRKWIYTAVSRARKSITIIL